MKGNESPYLQGSCKPCACYPQKISGSQKRSGYQRRQAPSLWEASLVESGILSFRGKDTEDRNLLYRKEKTAL